VAWWIGSFIVAFVVEKRVVGLAFAASYGEFINRNIILHGSIHKIFNDNSL